jgi:hypothetical protein
MSSGLMETDRLRPSVHGCLLGLSGIDSGEMKLFPSQPALTLDFFNILFPSYWSDGWMDVCWSGMGRSSGGGCSIVGVEQPAVVD